MDGKSEYAGQMSDRPAHFFFQRMKERKVPNRQRERERVRWWREEKGEGKCRKGKRERWGPCANCFNYGRLRSRFLLLSRALSSQELSALGQGITSKHTLSQPGASVFIAVAPNLTLCHIPVPATPGPGTFYIPVRFPRHCCHWLLLSFSEAGSCLCQVRSPVRSLIRRETTRQAPGRILNLHFGS